MRESLTTIESKRRNVDLSTTGKSLVRATIPRMSRGELRAEGGERVVGGRMAFDGFSSRSAGGEGVSVPSQTSP